MKFSPLLLAALLFVTACAEIAPQAAPGGLEGTAWRLVRFQGGDDTVLTPDDNSKYTIAFAAGGAFNVRFDCNRGRGTWKASPPLIEFGPLALTRAMCPPGSLHDRLVRQWPFVRSYVLKDGHLFLSLMADGGIYEFEPAQGAVVKGTATFRERMALPAHSVLEVTLENTYWKLTQLGDVPVRAAPQQREAHFILHPADRRVTSPHHRISFFPSSALSISSSGLGVSDM